jgi:hypothetical protein
MHVEGVVSPQELHYDAVDLRRLDQSQKLLAGNRFELEIQTRC